MASTTFEAPIIADEKKTQTIIMDVLRISMHVLSSRALIWFAVIVGCYVWYMTVEEPTTPRIITCTAFCVTVLWPIIWRDRNGN